LFQSSVRGFSNIKNGVFLNVIRHTKNWLEFPTFADMTGVSWIFFLVFAVPLIALLFWLLKQDRRKGLWGIIILILLVAAAIFVSSRASRNAIDNFEIRKKEAQQKDSATP